MCIGCLNTDDRRSVRTEKDKSIDSADSAEPVVMSEKTDFLVM
jgi:hypothetical protein